ACCDQRQQPRRPSRRVSQPRPCRSWFAPSRTGTASCNREPARYSFLGNAGRSNLCRSHVPTVQSARARGGVSSRRSRDRPLEAIRVRRDVAAAQQEVLSAERTKRERAANGSSHTERGTENGSIGIPACGSANRPATAFRFMTFSGV